jgi:perosamine synthetase
VVLIPVYTPDLSGNAGMYLLQAIGRGDVSGHGDFVHRFEKTFAEYVGVDHAIAVSSGTAALEVALHSVGVVAGDEVILPSFTIISCAAAVLRLGATPVLVDVDPETWCIDVAQVERAITKKTRAVMPVHMMGHPAHCMSLETLCVKRGLLIVEDACQAHGASINGDGRSTLGRSYVGEFRCGDWGAAAAFSFYANKLITCGEGGMVTTDSDEVAERARSYRNLCFGTGPNKFIHTDLGYNFRMSNLNAAVGLAQLEKIDEHLDKKRAIARRYRDNLSGHPRLRLQAVQPWARPSYWMNGIVLNDMFARTMIEALRDQGIESRPFFVGLHEQPIFLKRSPWNVRFKSPLPVTGELSSRGLYLPSGLDLTDGQVDFVCEIVEEVLK